MTKLIILFVTFLSITISLAQTVYTGKVIAIKDGDTVSVIDNLNTQTTLKLAEVDCLEKNQPFGNKAKQFASDQVYLKTVKYIVYKIDRFGSSIKSFEQLRII